MPDRNLIQLHRSTEPQEMAKLRMYVHYFERTADEELSNTYLTPI